MTDREADLAGGWFAGAGSWICWAAVAKAVAVSLDREKEMSQIQRYTLRDGCAKFVSEVFRVQRHSMTARHNRFPSLCPIECSLVLRRANHLLHTPSTDTPT